MLISRVVRLLIAAGGVVALVVGLASVAGGAAGGLVWVVLGVTGILAVVFEETRYRSEAAAPGPPFQRTDEAFLDPTTKRRMRVYVDPTTGERRYHAET